MKYLLIIVLVLLAGCVGEQTYCYKKSFVEMNDELYRETYEPLLDEKRETIRELSDELGKLKAEMKYHYVHDENFQQEASRVCVLVIDESPGEGYDDVRTLNLTTDQIEARELDEWKYWIKCKR